LPGSNDRFICIEGFNYAIVNERLNQWKFKLRKYLVNSVDVIDFRV
jgi:hypothetical protein